MSHKIFAHKILSPCSVSFWQNSSTTCSLFMLSCFGWGKGGNFTSAGWQVILCDPIWHVSSRSSEAFANCYMRLLYCHPVICYSSLSWWNKIVHSRVFWWKELYWLFLLFVILLLSAWMFILEYRIILLEEFLCNLYRDSEFSVIPAKYAFMTLCNDYCCCGVICVQLLYKR